MLRYSHTNYLKVGKEKEVGYKKERKKSHGLILTVYSIFVDLSTHR